MGLYNGVLKAELSELVYALMRAVVVGALIITTAIFAADDNLFSRLLFGIFIIVNFVLLLAEKIILRNIWARAQKNVKDRQVVLVSNPEGVFKFTNLVSKDEDIRLKILGYFSINRDQSYVDGISCLGSLKNFNHFLIQKTVDEVIFVLPKDYISDMEEYIVTCEELGITVRMLLDLYDLKISKTQISYMGNIPMLIFHTVSLNEDQQFIKRLIDIFVSLIGLFITGILYIILGPIIKLQSPGPVLYSQPRVGRNGRIFKCYKFRSMYADADERKKELEHLNKMKGAIFKIENDPRITPIGKIIRKYSLDEFPQFWNVLKGEMSLVGTRPPTVDEVKQYENRHWRRLSIKPGITGLWQVSGRNNIEDFDEIVALDVKYIDNWSIWLDLKIIAKTVVAVFKKTGV
jgi:exopolysaccharide biosynthesis polyprenyl glycosylphosphotransferase